MPHINHIYKNLENVHNSPNVIDTLIEVDRVFDRLDLYAYENWFKGEIVEGPFVERHWVDLTLMYPHKMMPNPDAAMRLVKHGCKVKFGQDVLETFVKVKSADDLIETEDGQRLPKTEKHKVWLVNVRLPKTLLDVAEEIKDISDDIDLEAVDSAYQEELDGEKGLEQQDSTSEVTPGNEQQTATA